ncbi:phospholipid carrier-dependent glycosyltransferase [Geodermatophilus sp. DSM 45219]|uniref:phospholipid carrier-dependent glycosyltransferase n=1 Tax=Geodermatophilus sp. DSM 45219 TaxID=1881103 RepID=UPI0008887F25|nr:phospholipid carrier-dependent glycosyltransferase [Geodermatophilus sp. DSM 45219]SDN54657.1 Dolichyl-phosphate-mannose-protein mannosyltransferase [Geodermatophilus sp. DSM 45219]
MTLVDQPHAPVEAASGSRPGRAGAWRRVTSMPLLVAATLAALAFAVRSVGLTRGFELWIDEMHYADLGASISRGEMPALADGPFFLHPPGFFLLEGAVIRLLDLQTADSMDLVYDLRWLTAALGALAVGLAFLLVRRVAGTWPAVWAAAVLVFEPFVLRNNSRVFLETPATVAVLAGLLLLARHLGDRDQGRPRLRLFLAGLLLGLAVLTKDVFAFYAVAPVLLAVVWRRTIPFRDATTVLLGVVVPYTAYLALLWGTGYLGLWTTAKVGGFLRLVGAEQTTGFNAPGAPSLVERLLDQAQAYGTSYLLLLLCPLAGLVAAASSRPGRRLVGLTAVVMGSLGAFLALFGTLEEHFGYPVVVAGATALAVAGAEVVDRRPSLRKAAAVVSSVLLAAVASLGLSLATGDDDGFLRFRAWAATELPADARVGVTNDTSVRAFRDDDRFGPWSTAEQLEENGARYVLTVSLPTEQGYARARPDLLEWLEDNGTPLFRDVGPTNGETVLWSVDQDDLTSAADRGVGGPPPPPLDAGTAGEPVPEGGDGGTP